MYQKYLEPLYRVFFFILKNLGEGLHCIVIWYKLRRSVVVNSSPGGRFMAARR